MIICDGCGRGYGSPLAAAECADEHAVDDHQARRASRAAQSRRRAWYQEDDE